MAQRPPPSTAQRMSTEDSHMPPTPSCGKPTAFRMQRVCRALILNDLEQNRWKMGPEGVGKWGRKESEKCRKSAEFPTFWLDPAFGMLYTTDSERDTGIRTRVSSPPLTGGTLSSSRFVPGPESGVPRIFNSIHSNHEITFTERTSRCTPRRSVYHCCHGGREQGIHG